MITFRGKVLLPSVMEVARGHFPRPIIVVAHLFLGVDETYVVLSRKWVLF